LRASGKIKLGMEDIGIDISGTEFLPSKSEPLRIIEPRRRRLKRGGSEVKEIQYFKGKEKKNKKSKWGF
jgi:hypothetical protein